MAAPPSRSSFWSRPRKGKSRSSWNNALSAAAREYNQLPERRSILADQLPHVDADLLVAIRSRPWLVGATANDATGRSDRSQAGEVVAQSSFCKVAAGCTAFRSTNRSRDAVMTLFARVVLRCWPWPGRHCCRQSRSRPSARGAQHQSRIRLLPAQELEVSGGDGSVEITQGARTAESILGALAIAPQILSCHHGVRKRKRQSVLQQRHPGHRVLLRIYRHDRSSGAQAGSAEAGFHP